MCSWSIHSGGLFALLEIRCAVPLEQVVGVRLRRRVWVRVVEQVLDAEKDLLDGDGWLPSLLLVDDGEADRA